MIFVLYFVSFVVVKLLHLQQACKKQKPFATTKDTKEGTKEIFLYLDQNHCICLIKKGHSGPL